MFKSKGWNNGELNAYDYPILPAVQEFAGLAVPGLGERERKAHKELSALGLYFIVPFTYEKIFIYKQNPIMPGYGREYLLSRLKSKSVSKVRRTADFERLVDYVFNIIKSNWNDTPESKIKQAIRQRYIDEAERYLMAIERKSLNSLPITE